jgi:hypothetical protein
MLGETKTLEIINNRCGVENEWDPTEETGSVAPLPTMMDEGLIDHVCTGARVNVPIAGAWWS